MGDDKELQVENGHFTRIVNPLLENLIKVPFRGCELAIAIFILRKTYGFQKTQDEISLTQLEKGVARSRPTIVKALKNLQLVNILQLVKAGTSKKRSNLWHINKYFNTWELVKMGKLVKKRKATSKELRKQLVKTGLHTKEIIQKKDNTKDNSKAIALRVDSNQIVDVIKSFEGVNKACADFYGNTTQREYTAKLIETYGFEKVQHVVAFLPKMNEKLYNKAVTPKELWDKWAKIEAEAKGLKNKGTKYGGYKIY